jgi:hypothetical protein
VAQALRMSDAEATTKGTILRSLLDGDDDQSCRSIE